MSLIVPDVGEVVLLEMLRSGVPLTACSCYLFQNNMTPDQNTVLADLTQATFSGYAASVCNFGAATIVSHKGKIVGTAPLTFTHNGGGTANTIYGYYVKITTTSDLIYVERFSASQLMTNNGDQIGITLSFTGNSEN